MLCPSGPLSSCVRRRRRSETKIETCLNYTYSSLLNESTQAAAEVHEQIFHAGPLDALLLTDFTANLCAAPDVQDRDELRQGVHQTALAHLLCILTECVAGDNIRDDAYK